MPFCLSWDELVSVTGGAGDGISFSSLLYSLYTPDYWHNGTLLGGTVCEAGIMNLASAGPFWITNLNLVITVSADDRAPKGARASAGTVLMIKVRVNFKCSFAVNDFQFVFAV